MSLPNYPFPQLGETLDEISRVLKLCLDPEDYEDFLWELKTNHEFLKTEQSHFIDSVKNSENWATDFFTKQLLSLREPIPVATSIPVLLQASQTHNDQISYASSLLWSVAQLRTNTSVIKSFERTTKFKDLIMEDTQQSELFSSCRIPCEITDKISISTKSRGALVLYKGSAFIVNIISTSGEPLSFGEIYEQINAIRNYTGELPPSICKFTALNREKWKEIRENISSNSGKTSLDLMEESIVAIAIEEQDCPTNYCEALNHLRVGEKAGNLRYYDKILNIVVYKNCISGLLFEHTIADGFLMLSVSQLLYRMAENVKIDINNVHSLHVTPISFKFENLGKQDVLIPKIEYFDFHSYPDVFSLLKEERLYEIWINFSLQLSIKQTFGNMNFLLVTPTHVRHFKHGRSDPTYTVTTQSLEFINDLNSNASEKKLFDSFVEAVKEHKKRIKSTKLGDAIGAHIGQIRNWLFNKNESNKLGMFLEKFGNPAIYLTGYESVEGIELSVANTYAREQIAITYLGKTDKVRIVMNVRGHFQEKLNKFKNNFKKAMNAVQKIACKVAIASQMGAMESVNNFEQLIENNQPFSIILHGGAGEKISLERNVQEMVEFSLKAALSIGIHSLKNGESALDAVEKVVVSLENCFLFNAGKGSVYNQEKKHELEASIIDGKNGVSGSVACLTTVKNPIKAARIVMEKSPHAFIVGTKAEELAKEFNLSIVDNTFFDTDFRHNELNFHKYNEERNHTQTVGAVALDIRGNLAAASSTGGTTKKSQGRISDTAIVGAGIYSDENVAIACSGNGEKFIRNSIASKIASHYNLKKVNLAKSCREVLDEELGSSFGGVIAINSNGSVEFESRAEAMFIGLYDGKKPKVTIVSNSGSINRKFVLRDESNYVTYLHTAPVTPGVTIIESRNSKSLCAFDLPKDEFNELFLEARRVAILLRKKMSVNRCAMIMEPNSDQPPKIKIIPLHNVSADMKQYISNEIEFNSEYPGYCTSRNGPRALDAQLDDLKAKIRPHLESTAINYRFDGDINDDNLFSKIIRGEEIHWRIWEDDEHVAFLTPFPNSLGFTVVVPRKHLSSDLFSIEENEYLKLLGAAYSVSKLLKRSLDVDSCATIFEGFEIDYAHIKIIPIIRSKTLTDDLIVPTVFHSSYQGYITSLDGPEESKGNLQNLYNGLCALKPPKSWLNPESHSEIALNDSWYRMIFDIQNTLYHATVQFFHDILGFYYVLTPMTTETVSSPMGLGSDSEPVHVNLSGQNVNIADSMQFALEYFLRLKNSLVGTYYVSPSFRGESPDSTHLNQFYHVECELLGDFDAAIDIAEKYIRYLTQELVSKHSDLILKSAGKLSHIESLLKRFDKNEKLPRITLDDAIDMMYSNEFYEFVEVGRPELGRKLTRKGEKYLIDRFEGPVWLTEMDHLSVPFYQAYTDRDKRKAKAGDLLLGLGETLGLGERHVTPKQVQDALAHHEVDATTYDWYINMREINPLLTSGWGMGTERYLCWLLQHDDVRDMHVMPRMNGMRFRP